MADSILLWMNQIFLRVFAEDRHQLFIGKNTFRQIPRLTAVFSDFAKEIVIKRIVIVICQMIGVDHESRTCRHGGSGTDRHLFKTIFGQPRVIVETDHGHDFGIIGIVALAENDRFRFDLQHSFVQQLKETIHETDAAICAISVIIRQNRSEIELDSVRIETARGVLQLAGAQLNVTSLDLDSGEVKLTGRIDTVEYTAARTPGGFLSRLLR